MRGQIARKAETIMNEGCLTCPDHSQNFPTSLRWADSRACMKGHSNLHGGHSKPHQQAKDCGLGASKKLRWRN